MSVNKVKVVDFGGNHVNVPISDLSNFRAYENKYGSFTVAVDVNNHLQYRTPRTTDVSWSITGGKDDAERMAENYNCMTPTSRKVMTARNIEVMYEPASDDTVNIANIFLNGKPVVKVNYMVRSRHPGGYGSVPQILTHNAHVKVGVNYNRGYVFSHNAVDIRA